MLAATAPADVPTMIGNGHSGRGWISARAFRTPTWYAARAPPPVRISPVRESPLPVLLVSLALRPSPMPPPTTLLFHSTENNMLALRRTLVTALIAVAASVSAGTPAASPAEGAAAPAFKLQDQ